MILPIEPTPTRLQTAFRCALPLAALLLTMALALRAALS